MKKLYILLFALVGMIGANAQWVTYECRDFEYP